MKSNFTVSSEDFALIAGVSKVSVCKWHKKGIGPTPKKVGGAHLYRQNDIIQFLTERTAAKERKMRELAARRSPLIIRNNRKLRREFGGKLEKILIDGRVTLADARKLAATAGYPSMNELDARGCALVIAKLRKQSQERTTKSHVRPAGMPRPAYGISMRRRKVVAQKESR